MNRLFKRETVKSREFALVELYLVVVCGAVLCLYPKLGAWTITASLIPWGLRLVAGESPFRRTRFDFFIAVFILTAISGYWASYNQITASHKFYLIVTSILLYYALSAQPGENLAGVSALFFCVGVGVALFFLLTQDFIADPRKVELANQIGRWVMQIRPFTGWNQIHPNYAAGIAAIMMPFGIYLVLNHRKNAALLSALIFGLFLIAAVILMATSRGVWMAIVSAAGVWLLWRILHLVGIRSWLRNEAVFPSSVIFCIGLIVTLLYAGPASIGGNVVGQDSYGSGSRAELFWRSIYLVSDFPITGGGLGSFPGLYSQYIFGVPYYHVPNAHNIFLDVFIEQGGFGGIAFLLIFLGSIWMAARNLGPKQNRNMELSDWLLFSSLMIACVHGLVDDYLYNGVGSLLALFLAGIAVQRFGAEPIFKTQRRFDRTDIIVVASIGVLFVGLVLVYRQTIRSIWYSNIGAVQMARVELAGFPTNQWAGPRIVENLQDAEASLLTSLGADPANRTANHRLGLIAMLQWHYSSAVMPLSVAHQSAPHHRGINKSLGLCHAWLGDLEQARLLLGDLPEAQSELEVYIWWWQAQGQEQYARNASVLLPGIPSSIHQP